MGTKNGYKSIMVAMSSPWKDPRTGIYHIRRGIPVELREQLGREYKRSLGTKDPTEAKSLFAIALVECDRVFDEARARLLSPVTTELSRDEAERYANIWLAQELGEDEDYRVEGMSPSEHECLQESVDIVDIGGTDALAHTDITIIEFDVDDFILTHNLGIAKDSPAYRQLAYSFLKASVRLNGFIAQRQRGEPVDTPSIPDISHSKITASSDTEALSKIYEDYKREVKPAAESEMDKAIRRFIQLHGDLAITDIKRIQVSEFKDALLKLPSRPKHAIRDMPVLEVIRLMEGDTTTPRLKPTSVKKDISVIHAVLQWAVDNGYIDSNPATLMKVRTDKRAVEQRLPYSPDDLLIIFNSPIFTEGFRMDGGAGEAAYWLPLIGLYTGARLDELGQLRVKDIHHEDGIWYIDINTDGENKKLKTLSSKRKVPLHKNILTKGFTEYLSSLKQSGMLFPELKADTKGVLTGNWSKWWRRYARRIGMHDERKVFHSFRHTFKDACREAGIHEEVHDALTGHSGGGAGRSYGSGNLSLAVLYQAIEQLAFNLE